MPIANCKRCGRIYNKVGREICPACTHEQDEVFHKVRDYLKQHNNASMSDVVRDLGVDLEDVVELIQDGRLILRDNPNMGYPCERCGGQTRAGRFCAKCASELAAELETARTGLLQNKQEKRGTGFHTRS